MGEPRARPAEAGTRVAIGGAMKPARVHAAFAPVRPVALGAVGLGLPALCLMSMIGGCSAADTRWVDEGTHRSLDASRCDGRPAPTSLRCVAPRGGAVALGLCGDLVADNTLTIEERDAAATELAVDGAVRIASPLHVAGDLWAIGDIDSPNTLDVQTLATAGTWRVASPAHVRGDAHVAESVVATNSVTIDGTLFVGASDALANVTAGAVVDGAVRVPSALACAEAVSIDALVTSAGPGVVPSDLLSPVDAPSELTLGCGTYVLDAMDVNAPLDIHVVGPTVLVIRGDVRIASPTSIDVAPGATLDVVVGGAVAVDNTLDVSAASDDAVWIGVGDGLRVASPMHLTGVLAMPDADIAGDNTLEVWGAVMARDLRVASPMVVHDGASLAADGCLVTE